MQYLYVSSLCSKRQLDDIFKRTKTNPGFAIQKFARLLLEGFAANGADISTLSSLPIVPRDCRKRCWAVGREKEAGIQYHYVPFLNIPFLRQACLVLYTFFYVLFWGLKDRKNKCIICDVLKVSICASARFAASLCGVKTVGLVTDMPGLMVSGHASSLYETLATGVNKSYLSSFSQYVFLTEQMNGAINKHNRPYIVMEGLADITMSEYSPLEKSTPKVLLYAGGLHERYGLKMLVEAFVAVGDENWNLVIYGNGPYADELMRGSYKGVIYKGVAANEEVVQAERRATLLVNPRPTSEDFTKYSFPSKNIEYMASGTPLLTTRLPGMPSEYYPHVFLFDEETTEGYADTLRTIFNRPEEELTAKGLDAREFILSKKNNVVQATRVIELINGK